MIASETVAEIQRLLAEKKHSQRKIALLAGVCRGTVGAIAAGKRPDYETIRQPEEDLWAEPSGPPQRCPACGGMVYMPCRLCHARRAIAKKRRARNTSDGTGLASGTLGGTGLASGTPFRLELRPEHRARYEEVRAWRRQNHGRPMETEVSP
jgi:hypothetical protein